MKKHNELSDEELKQALSLFRETVHEFRPTGERGQSPAFAGWRVALAVFAMVAVLFAVIPMYHQHQMALANAAAQRAALVAQEEAKQDDALLREVESDVSLSVPQPMQRLELLMASDSAKTSTERSQ